MEEILHQLIWRIYHYLQGLIHPRWCRIFSINSSTTEFGLSLSQSRLTEDFSPKFSLQFCVWLNISDPLQSNTLQGINISHLGKRKIIFKMAFLGDMLVSWRVNRSKTRKRWSKHRLINSCCSAFHGHHHFILFLRIMICQNPYPPKTMFLTKFQSNQVEHVCFLIA